VGVFDWGRLKSGWKVGVCDLSLKKNRNGLLAEFDVHHPIEVSEAAMALRQLLLLESGCL